MSMIRCPECGARISDKARICPVCGYVSEDALRPISEQETFLTVPYIQSEDNLWDVFPCSYQDNLTIMEYLSDHKNLTLMAPDLASAIQQLFKGDNVLIADIDQFTRKLIEKGDLRFTFDKAGKILPMLKESDNRKFFSQIRLKEAKLNPEVGIAVHNLYSQIALASILDELKEIGNDIRNIKEELQQDRYAMVDSALDKMRQAYYVCDHRLQVTAVQLAVSSATDAKRVMMRNYPCTLNAAIRAKKPVAATFDAVRDLVMIVNCVRLECEGYSYIDEVNACKECLTQFLVFIQENKLKERDTLLRLNNNLPPEKSFRDLPAVFIGAVDKLEAFVNNGYAIVSADEGANLHE